MGFVSTRVRRLETQRASYRADTENVICSHLPLASAEGGQSGLETRVVGSGERAEDYCQDLRVESRPLLQKPSFLGGAGPSLWHQPKRKH